MKLIGSAILTIAVSFLVVRTQAQSTQVKVTGFLTDTLSGRHGANPAHADAARRNVFSGIAQYAIYDEKTKKLYIFDQQAAAIPYLGQRVTVAGALTACPMAHAGQHVNPRTNQAEDLHHVGQDSSTPIAGVLTIFSIAAVPARDQRK
jgi:hypothetical protein